MKNKMYWVYFNGLTEQKVFKEYEQSFDNENWSFALAQAHKNTAVTVNCLCEKRDPDVILRRLKVSHSIERNKYWLSSWPHSGHEHKSDCRYFSPWPNALTSMIYTSDVLTTNVDGTFTIKLNVGLNTQSQQMNQTEIRNRALKSHRTNTAMSLLGLAHFLWEKAEITVWKPIFGKNGPRKFGWLASRLNNAAKLVKIGKVPLTDVLLVNASNYGEPKDRNIIRVKNAREKKQRLIIISLMLSDKTKTYEALATGILKLSSPFGFPTLKISEEIFNQTKQKFSSELNYWEKGHKVVAVIETKPPVRSFSTKDGMTKITPEAEIISLQLMCVTDRYIPVDSFQENELENNLINNARGFIKPLLYETADFILPSFILTDMETGFVPMEILDCNTEISPLIHEEKRKRYQETYGDAPWWSWTVTQKDKKNKIPPLPIKS